MAAPPSIENENGGSAIHRTIRKVAASAAVLVCVVFAAGGARDSSSGTSLGITSLRLGGDDGSGDVSAFSRAGFGIDAKTAVNDDESITSSLDKMLHPPKKPKPAWQGGEVMGKDGQTYASIPSDIMDKFKRARTQSPSADTGGEHRNSHIVASSPVASPAVSPAVYSLSRHAAAHSSASDSQQPPAWALAEARKMQQQAAQGAAHAFPADSVAWVATAPAAAPSLDTYDEYKAEYEASLHEGSIQHAAPAAGDSETQTQAADAPASKETVAQLARLQQQIEMQTSERNQEVSGLMKEMKALTGPIYPSCVHAEVLS